jgi:hypothetical protein
VALYLLADVQLKDYLGWLDKAGAPNWTIGETRQAKIETETYMVSLAVWKV